METALRNEELYRKCVFIFMTPQCILRNKNCEKHCNKQKINKTTTEKTTIALYRLFDEKCHVLPTSNLKHTKRISKYVSENLSVYLITFEKNKNITLSKIVSFCNIESQIAYFRWLRFFLLIYLDRYIYLQKHFIIETRH